MQVGHDQQTSTNCKSKLQFGLDNQLSTLVLKFNFIFSISSGYGQTVFKSRHYHQAVAVGGNFYNQLHRKKKNYDNEVFIWTYLMSLNLYYNIELLKRKQ